MSTPLTRESKFKNKKHFMQRHPVIGRFFESFGCLAWVIIIAVVASITMYLVPPWRPTLFVIFKNIGHAWNYFWGDFINQCIRWDWNKQPTPK
jgi:hypothetical protein